MLVVPLEGGAEEVHEGLAILRPSARQGRDLPGIDRGVDNLRPRRSGGHEKRELGLRVDEEGAARARDRVVHERRTHAMGRRGEEAARDHLQALSALDGQAVLRHFDLDIPAAAVHHPEAGARVGALNFVSVFIQIPRRKLI